MDEPLWLLLSNILALAHLIKTLKPPLTRMSLGKVVHFKNMYYALFEVKRRKSKKENKIFPKIELL